MSSEDDKDEAVAADPNVIELSDLVQAANDWLSGQAAPGYQNPITLPQLVQLVNEWLGVTV